MTTTSTPPNNNNNNNMIEFYHRVKTDGIILIQKNDRIIKNKPISHLTVDLQYDAKAKVFLDANKNVYIFDATIHEIFEI